MTRRSSRRTPRACLVTAGPTREYVDPVRFLSNESSGLMGFSIAVALARRGHEVTLIAGPVNQPTPKGVERVDVVTAREMLAALRSRWSTCEALFMAAAVADWRPAVRRAGKWRAKDGGATRTTLDLVRNPDVLASLTRGRRDPDRTVVAFALETGDGVRRARAKLASKGADWIVLNSAAALNARRSAVRILGADGLEFDLALRDKSEVAERLADLLELESLGE